MAHPDALESGGGEMLEDGRRELRGKRLTFYLLKRFPTEDEARGVLEPQLRAWEIASGIPSGRIVLRFEFLSSSYSLRRP